MKKNHYISGQWNFVCDSCGQKLKSGESRQRWDGFQVCSECWEPRHPQDFVRARQDRISVPWSRPQTDVFNIQIGFFDTVTFDDVFLSEGTFYYTESDSVNITDLSSTYKSTNETDSVSFSETVLFNIGKSFSDNLLVDDGDYFEELPDSYLVSNDDYIFPSFTIIRSNNLTDSTNITETQVFTLTRVLSDSTSLTDSGTITIPEYIDITFFAEDYLAVEETF